MADTTFVYVTYISTTPEKVWAALSDPEMTKDYWARHRNVSDWKPGSTWAHEDIDSGTADVVGQVIESEPPTKLVLSWDSPKAPGRPSRVTFQIEPFMEAVRLTVIHEELEVDSPMHKGVSQGWPAVLSSLKTMIETGKAMPMTMKRWHAPPK
ncbi:SRPBCC family protein [Limnoglobus roseus]|uniref:ATPase n=1 Tax=Limnoglobus roseus TaxID=2598579 RepID=A0A5C1ACK2_9BACT|nr:SRPBCC family protein [Limnoglobus roseus]QEL14768.1 ATPase [Limnoglobus roseus]